MYQLIMQAIDLKNKSYNAYLDAPVNSDDYHASYDLYCMLTKWLGTEPTPKKDTVDVKD